MKVRGTKFWEMKITTELSKPIDKQFVGLSCEPRAEELANYMLAEFIVMNQAKSNKSKKLVA